VTGTERRDGRQGLVRVDRVIEGDRNSRVAEELGRQLGTGDRGLGGSDGFETTFPETLHEGRVLDNWCRSANSAARNARS
jgi:hypothetical protein